MFVVDEINFLIVTAVYVVGEDFGNRSKPVTSAIMGGR